jgi:ankyrin repeat protein
MTKVTSNANLLIDGIFPSRNQLHSLSPTCSPTSPYWEEFTLLEEVVSSSWIQMNVSGFMPQFLGEGSVFADQTLFVEEKHNLLTDLFNLKGSNEVEYLSHIRSQMQTFSLERYDGELSMRLQRLFDDSNNQILFNLFEFIIYLTSNNVLSANQIDRFSKWIIEQKHDGVLRSCLKIQMPTANAFAEKVLESALRIGDVHLLQLLIDSEIDKRLLSGLHGGRYLRNAAEKGNTKVAQILLENGADVNVPVCEEYASTALHAAVRGGEVNLVQTLLEAGAKPNIAAYFEYDADRDDEDEDDAYENETPLSEAIEKRHAELVGILVGAGASVNICTVEKMDAMTWAERNVDDQLYQILCAASRKDVLPITFNGIFKAASFDSQALSDYLNEKGANVRSNAKRKLEAALQAAADPEAFHGVNRDAVISLLEIGVDPNAEDNDVWYKPLVSAAGENDLELVEILLKAGADANAPFVLERAARPINNLELLTVLLEEGADIQTYGGKALEQAASEHNLEAVQFLLASGADVNAPIRSKGYGTPLQAATNNTQLVRVLIKAGAAINACTAHYTGRTALQTAAYHGNIGSVIELLSAGADINAPGRHRDGFTALQVAAKWQHTEVVQSLLDAGADVNAPGSPIGGYTALQAACDRENIKLAQILVDAGADVNATRKRQSITMLQSAIKRGSFEMAQLLLRAGANVNSPPRGMGGRSAIQEAAEKGNRRLLDLLLEAGADVNGAARVEYGRTALQAAVSAEKPNMGLVEVLLKAGADINAPAGFKGGLTALQGAAIRGHINIALKFLEAGADINAPPAIIDGRTALDGAAEYGHLDMVQVLLNAGARSDFSNDERFNRAIELAEKNGHFAVAKLLKSSLTEPTGHI